MIDRRLVAQIDWSIVGTTIVLGIVGLSTIYSATYLQWPHIYTKQFYWLLVGVVLFVVAVVFDYALLERYGFHLFVLSMLTLVAVLFVGHSSGGAQRWLSLGVVSFQPSEFAKLALIIVLAKYFSAKKVPKDGMRLKDLGVPALILAVPFILVVKQPDLGTALVYCLICGSIGLVVRVRIKTILWLMLVAAPIVPLAWGSLKSYQKARVLGFINPDMDPLGSGYHVLQSKIAIGSGGIFGKGFTQGTQGSLHFLPEHHTDFIFPVLAEEWGLVGSFAALMLFLALIMRGLNTAKNAKDRFGFLLAFGISMMFFWHVAINLGMAFGLLPVVGVALPFLSYGGSSLITTLIGVGLLVNIGMRRYMLG